MHAVVDVSINAFEQTTRAAGTHRARGLAGTRLRLGLPDRARRGQKATRSSSSRLTSEQTAMAERVRSNAPEAVTVEDVSVHEVVAHA